MSTRRTRASDPVGERRPETYRRVTRRSTRHQVHAEATSESDAAGPSASAPIRRRRTTNALAVEAEDAIPEDANQLEHHNGEEPEEEDAEVTPRATRSGASRRRHAGGVDSLQDSGPLGRASKRRRLKIRPSLAEPGVRETDIGRRAEMLADLAGDCLVACLRPGDGAGRNSDGGRKLWHGLKGGCHGSLWA
jgi:hypothetical protein